MTVDVDALVSEHILKKLEDSFGKAVAMMIMATATRSSGVPTCDLTLGEYRQLIGAICVDERCVGMWGETGVEQVRQQWEALA